MDPDRLLRKLASELLWGTGIRGLVLILFGILAILWPVLTFGSLATLFAAYVLVSGIMNLITAAASVGHSRTWPFHLILSILEIMVGAFAVQNPGASFTALALLVGLFLILRGLIEGVLAALLGWLLPKARALFTATGLLSVVAGVVIMAYPRPGSIVFTWILGIYALVCGAILVAVALEVRHQLLSLAERN